MLIDKSFIYTVKIGIFVKGIVSRKRTRSVLESLRNKPEDSKTELQQRCSTLNAFRLSDEAVQALLSHKRLDFHVAAEL